jgi:hypothetical protein
MNHAGAIDEATSDDPMQLFRDWQAACASLRAAETRGDVHAEIVRLSVEVIRTRNAVTLDRLHAGWNAPENVVRHLTLDDLLLREKDDAALSGNPPPSAAYASQSPLSV